MIKRIVIYQSALNPMEKDNSNEFKNNFSNEFTDKLSLTKTYHDFFQNVQVNIYI